jgi:hypothetical protein
MLQRLKTPGGEWTTDEYELKQDIASDRKSTPLPAADGMRGVDMTLRFTPNAAVNAELIGLTQTAQTIIAGAGGGLHQQRGRDGSMQKWRAPV